MSELFEYNTLAEPLVFSEYGRAFQNMVFHVCKIEDKDKRLSMCETLIGIMEVLNPIAKNQLDYKQKFWDHIHIISNFQLNVESPYPIPEIEQIEQKPEPIPYPNQPIKFRFYGRNLQLMVNKAATIEDVELKGEFVNLLASFMTNSSKSWNNENLSNGQLAEHLGVLSGNKITVNPEQLEITIDNSPNLQFVSKKKKFFKPNKFKNKNYNSKK